MVTVFGQPSTPKIISLSLDGNQFEIYNKISRNYTHSFLFESLTGPEELSETSIMGFDPEFIVKGYYDKVTIQKRDGSIEAITTSDPLNTIKEMVLKTSDQTYRYLGGAVGNINYDAIRLWEKIPKNHLTEEPIMEFDQSENPIRYSIDTKDSDSFKFKDSYLYVPEKPGLGVDIDENMVEKFSIDE